jgi:hypothetical protein
VSAITRGLPVDDVEYSIGKLPGRADSFRRRAVLADPLVDPLPPAKRPRQIDNLSRHSV